MCRRTCSETYVECRKRQLFLEEIFVVLICVFVCLCVAGYSEGRRAHVQVGDDGEPAADLLQG